MKSISIALVFAAAMILIAFGTSSGQIEQGPAAWLFFIIPAIAMSLLGRSKGRQSNGKGCC